MRIPMTRLALAALLAVGGAVGWTAVQGGTPSATPVPPADVAALLGGLQVAPEHPDGYVRAAFGDGWQDFDHDGCDSRAEVLQRDLERPVVQAKPCRVLSGVFHDPYSGISGEAEAGALDIDHVAALGDAWRSGAYTWSAAQREAYANDLDVLLAVNDTENRCKSDKGPAEWDAPPAASSATCARQRAPQDPKLRCAYATRYVTIKARYHLTVTEADRAALERMLGSCS